MAFRQAKKHISGNLIIDGSISANQIAANTITANKFSGAVEEEYWAYDNDQDISWSSSYQTVHSWNFPETELSLFKGRHVSYTAEGYMNTATSTSYTGTVNFQLQAEVPTVQPKTLIGSATHVSTPTTGIQIISFDGNLASNRIGSGGSVGLVNGSYRTYENLYYEPNLGGGSELVTNGTFTSNVNGWTVGAGAFASSSSKGRLNAAGSNDGYAYQALTTVVGKTYTVSGSIIDGTADAELRITSAANLDASSVIATTGVISSYGFTSFRFTATATTTYILLKTDNTSSTYQYVDFDTLSVKQDTPKTYLLISTSPSAIVPTDGTPTDVYYYPYGGASAGTYAVVDQYNQSTRTNPYTNYFRFDAEAYIGLFNDDLKLRLQCRNQIAYNKTLTVNDLKIFMQSRIVE